MKSKGCLILGYIAVISGYCMGVAAAVKEMLDGVSAAEIFMGTSGAFPSLTLQGAVLTLGFTLLTSSVGLSAVGIAAALPCGAAGMYGWGVFSASAFAAFGIKGIGRFLWAAPVMATMLLVLAAVSGDGIKASYFTLQRLGIITEPKSQYTEVTEAFSVPKYIRSTLFAILISVIITVYGHFVKGFVFG